MSEPQATGYGTGLPPPPPPLGGWYCNGCRRQNSMHRYQCQECRGHDTYDLCEHCIGRTASIHPGHHFTFLGSSGVAPCSSS